MASSVRMSLQPHDAVHVVQSNQQSMHDMRRLLKDSQSGADQKNHPQSCPQAARYIATLPEACLVHRHTYRSASRSARQSPICIPCVSCCCVAANHDRTQPWCRSPHGKWQRYARDEHGVADRAAKAAENSGNQALSNCVGQGQGCCLAICTTKADRQPERFCFAQHFCAPGNDAQVPV